MSLLSGAGLSVFGRPFGGMGVNAGDLDGDGLPDLVVANFEAEPNSFYRNVGGGIFEDLSTPSGFGAPAFAFSGFGLNLLDVANAGRLDAFVANGHVLEVPHQQGVTYAERPQLFWNDGKGRFVERGCGEPFRKAVVSRGSATADFDNDGDLDIAVSNSGGPLELLENAGEHGGWLGLVLVGRRSNRQGVGARVTLTTDAGRQVRETRAGESYLSSSRSARPLRPRRLDGAPPRDPLAVRHRADDARAARGALHPDRGAGGRFQVGAAAAAGGRQSFASTIALAAFALP